MISGGDGGLELGLKMTQYELYDDGVGGYEDIEEAARQALILHLAWGWQTAVSPNVNGKFVIWYRN